MAPPTGETEIKGRLARNGIDWDAIEKAQEMRFSALPPDASDEEVEQRSADIDDANQCPGRWVPYMERWNGRKWVTWKERWISDEDLAKFSKPASPGKRGENDTKQKNANQVSIEHDYNTDGNLALKPKGDLIPFRRLSIPEPSPSHQFDKKLWKASREKPGHLIRRIKGYDITEDKYGISYLFRLPGGATTTNQGEHAGYYNWLALEAAGRLKKVGEE